MHLLFRNTSGTIVLLNGSTFEPINEPVLTTHCARITDIAFSHNNEKMATASEDSLIEIHDIPDIIC